MNFLIIIVSLMYLFFLWAAFAAPNKPEEIKPFPQRQPHEDDRHYYD